MKLRMILSALVFFTGLVFGEDVTLTLKEAQAIKSYTPDKLFAEGLKPNDGDIIKLQFSGRGHFSGEREGGFEGHVCDANRGLSVVVPSSVRKWFFKIPEGSYGRVIVVFLQGDGKNWCMIGTTLETNFKDAKIKWNGQESK